MSGSLTASIHDFLMFISFNNSKMDDINAGMLDKSFISWIKNSGLGSKKRIPGAYQPAQDKMIWREKSAPKTVTGAGKTS